MMKKLLSYIICLMLLLPVTAYAADPTLAFSDHINGPDVGLGDSLGSGTIVTIWGNNLGSTQGASTISFRDSGTTVRSPYVYYWQNATGVSPGGPADLYTKLGMQEISFSIPDSAAGAGFIYVTVGGVTTNELPFFVTGGEIYWVRDTGNDSTGDGSWGNPWATYSSPSGATAKAGVSAGDIIYGYDSDVASITVLSKDGAVNANIGIASYPAHPLVTGAVSTANIADGPQYWVYSKMDVTSLATGIQPTPYGRIVGNKIWDGSAVGNTPGVDCAEGSGGAISGGGSPSGRSDQDDAKLFGNYIHDFGCEATSNQHHTTYFSVREHGSDINGMEIAYNYMINNWARAGIHFYDENDCWGYNTDTLIHHNWVENQVGPCFNAGAQGCNGTQTFIGDFYIYDNIFIECGQYGDNSTNIAAVQLSGNDLVGTYYFYNNTINGYGEPGQTPLAYTGALTVSGPTWSNPSPFAGEYHWADNIIVDTQDYIFFFEGSPFPNTPPASGSKNIWYDSDGTYGMPTWDTAWGDEESDPLFTSSSDFTLQELSPARDNGIDTSAVVADDFFGIARPQNSVYDIGATEYEDSVSGGASGFINVINGSGFTPFLNGFGFISLP